MKNKKLFAILTLVCFMMTLMPVAAFAATVADYTGKSNYTGIDASTVKAYIDGVEVEASYVNGIVSVSDYELTNGKHVVKFAAEDKMGNYGYKYGYITVNADTSAPTISPHTCSGSY